MALRTNASDIFHSRVIRSAVLLCLNRFHETDVQIRSSLSFAHATATFSRRKKNVV
ncbi:hypothetical protein M3J09_008824 [Ascochyta lentis]